MDQHVIPFAEYRPIAWAEARDDDSNPTCVILHLTASEATSQYDYFSNPANRACSNTHVDRDGGIEQYIRGDRLSAADSYGSSRAFSIETQGADANGYWTPEQCESNARIIAWAHQTYGIPLRLMKSSATGEEGVGWHRLGCDGNFPPMPNILAGRLQRGGGEVWSSAFGKVCPGDNRIKQIPGIVERAIAIAAGADVNPGGFLMALDDKAQTEMAKKVGFIDTRTEQTIEKLERIEKVNAIRHNASYQRERATLAEVTALSAGMKALAESRGVDGDALVAAVKDAATEALSRLVLPLEGEITLTPKES